MNEFNRTKRYLDLETMITHKQKIVDSFAVDERCMLLLDGDIEALRAEIARLREAAHSNPSCGCPVGQELKFISKLAWADQECPIAAWPKITTE